MSGVSPGWYRDPADVNTQRYWDGEQWVGAPLPVDVPPPATPPVATPSSWPPAVEQHGHARVPFPPSAGHAGAGREGEGRQREGPTGTDGAGADGDRARAAVDIMPPVIDRTHLAPQLVRLGARVIDIAAVFALNVVVNGYFFVEYYREVAPMITAWLAASAAGRPLPSLTPSEYAGRLSLTIGLISVALWFAYEVPATANTGQTLGKRLWRIKVERIDNQPLGFRSAFRRWFVLSLPSLLLNGLLGLPLQLIDCLWCTWDPLRQCLHDKYAKTVVVRATPRREPAEPGAG